MDIDKVFKSQPETNWVNKQRTLVVYSKGITDRAKQLMLDIFNLMPHAKKESKLEKGNWDEQIKDLCLLNSCRSFIFFESRKGRNIYLWLGRYPNGPTIKYQIENLHNAQDLKLQGNCMKGSRPILSFDNSFNEDPLLILQKELFIHAFNVPKHHPKSMPCCDRVFSWIKEGENSKRLWMRLYEVKYEKVGKEIIKNELHEIGPRLILNPVLLLEGCMSGKQLYKNEGFVSPKEHHLKKILTRREEMEKRTEKKVKLNQVLSLDVENDELDNIYDGEFIEQKQAKLDFSNFKEVQQVEL